MQTGPQQEEVAGVAEAEVEAAEAEEVEVAALRWASV